MGLKDKIKMGSDLMTSKLFDTNLIKNLQKDFHTIVENQEKMISSQNEMIISQTFLYQLLKIICESNGISIPHHIKEHFKIKQ